ncbi:hypothetical protein ACIA58_33610 [Kribbella sp. NPDC051586]|uniref:hypothetical protein n=1 Tax=Kribbella sp. NPDC051586 TaxID=3364118 RepID=UPI0037BA5AC1
MLRGSDAQGTVNLMLSCTLALIPTAVVTFAIGWRRSHRFVLKWAQAAGVVATILALGYVVAAAACLILEDRAAGPSEYPIFLLPVGLGALLAALAVLGTIVRGRHKLG